VVESDLGAVGCVAAYHAGEADVVGGGGGDEADVGDHQATSNSCDMANEDHMDLGDNIIHKVTFLLDTQTGHPACLPRHSPYSDFVVVAAVPAASVRRRMDVVAVVVPAELGTGSLGHFHLEHTWVVARNKLAVAVVVAVVALDVVVGSLHSEHTSVVAHIGLVAAAVQ